MLTLNGGVAARKTTYAGDTPVLREHNLVGVDMSGIADQDQTFGSLLP